MAQTIIGANTLTNTELTAQEAKRGLIAKVKLYATLPKAEIVTI